MGDICGQIRLSMTLVSHLWEAAGKPGKPHTSLSASLHEVIWKLYTVWTEYTNVSYDDGDDDNNKHEHDDDYKDRHD